MSEEIKKNIKRDYDDEPIIIKDYGAYFQYSLGMLIMCLVLIIWFKDWFDGNIKKLELKEILFDGILLILILWFLYYLYNLSKNFKKLPSYFYFSDSEIYQIEYFYDYKEKMIKTISPLDSAEYISYCIVAELQERYGRLHYLTTWQLYRKSSIGVHIGKLVLYIRFLLTYLLFVLPYKLYRLTKAKESYGLLKKNLFIHFENRNYFLVNIYSQKELDELLEYFKIHNIPIKNKTVFIPQAQNQMGWFADKNEIWTNEFKNKGERS
jgi:hypothetical protein